MNSNHCYCSPVLFKTFVNHFGSIQIQIHFDVVDYNVIKVHGQLDFKQGQAQNSSALNLNPNNCFGWIIKINVEK